MKECPRCGSSLSEYSLSDVEAYGCDSCGWVGVPVDHQSEPKRLESWQDAIQRFQNKFAAGGLDEHAERLERVEQARRNAVSGDVAEDVDDDEGDEPAVEDEDEEGTGDETVGDAAAGDADEADAPETDEEAAEAAADETAADDAAGDVDDDADDEAAATADDETEVAADGSGQ